MPLKRANGPSCSTMNSMTSMKPLNFLPSREGGGRDCRPTFATIRGWVAIVARVFDMAPSTAFDEHRNYYRILRLTESFPRPQSRFAWEDDFPQPLISSICNRR